MSMKSSKTEKFIFLAVLVLGAAVRLYRFGTVPAGLNQDEAFAAYESWALLTAGVDSSLHAWPVYLTAWGSGMNALETYLLLPLIALFGTKTWVIRLPQLLVSLLSIFAAWRLGRRIGTARTGLFFALLLAVCPWHVTMSRWGLESNLAPGFLLFGLCCFLRGLEERRFLLPSALFYGLALYAYSAIWPVMPLLLGLLVLYFRPKADRYLLGAGLILAVLALPLVAFLAVNYGWVGEFSLGPFSVPKLVELRAEDISLTAIPENLKTLCRVLFARSDGLVWNSPVPFGLFHPVSVPLALFGLGALVWRFARSMRGKAKDPAAALLIQIFAGFCLCLVITVNANRMNFLLLPLVLCAALGADALCSLAGRHAAKLAVGLAAAYLIFFGLFARSYFTDYADALRGQFTWGVQDALETALAHEGTVYVTDAVSYSKLLLIAEIDPYTFNETVEYERYPAAYLSARR
ncbi:MAG: glycosyltransferase family 39 protein, partial [Oscillospiraceae bacterium]|nr:glycosyltransferase family 39 protein [Oscillospiraceae bacterium]